MSRERNGFFKEELAVSDDENESFEDDNGRTRSYEDDYIQPGDERTEDIIPSESSKAPSPVNEESLDLRSTSDPAEQRTAQRPKTSRAGGLRPESAKRDRMAFDINQFSDPSLADELKELFKHITSFHPQEFDLETELKPFLPDYMPAIGDIDAFIKIKRPDQKNDGLGLSVLDEPETHQSDPSVLELHLRAITKSSTIGPKTVRTLDPVKLKKEPKLLHNWLKNIKDLHEKKPPASVHYSRRMPDIEDLMQVWPEPIEEALKTVCILYSLTLKMQLPTPDIDLPLAEYATVLALILDIPVSSVHDKVDKKGRKANPSNLIESLHVLFTLYYEFKNSAHFKAIDRGHGNTLKTDT